MANYSPEHAMIEPMQILAFVPRFLNHYAYGVIFLIATFWPEGLCMAEHTTPYAPSPTTSWMSYCSETLKEIFLEPPDEGGARDILSTSSLAQIVRGWKVFSVAESTGSRSLSCAFAACSTRQRRSRARVAQAVSSSGRCTVIPVSSLPLPIQSLAVARVLWREWAAMQAAPRAPYALHIFAARKSGGHS